MTNRQLADAMGMKITSVRMKCYEMGLKRMELEGWTREQVAFLKKHYKKIGDTELAAMFSERWQKDKGWTKKHIEKKRRYLGLKRTAEEIRLIKKRNIELGYYAVANKKMWKARGVTPIGEIRYWKNSETGNLFVVIKTKDGFVHFAPWLYKKEIGDIPEGYVIGFKDRNNFNIVKENLEIITRAEHARRNAIKRTAYPEELKQTIKLFNKLKKSIRNAQQK